jgi:YihY family inner membrane protein
VKLIDPRTTYVLRHPFAFALQVLKAFRANQGLLLAGAVAYYALLSIVPLLILMVIALSQVIGEQLLLSTLGRALEYVVPGRDRELVAELKAFLDHRQAVGWVLLVTLLFFSSLGFRVLENAISVIFLHRVMERRRHWAVTLLLPFGYVIFIGVAFFAGTYVIADLVAMGGERLVILGHSFSLGGPARFLIYVAGVIGEIVLISAIYYFMPAGRLLARHALIGGAAAGLLWEVIRLGLAWFFGTLSQVSVVYGSLATAIVVLISMEVAATVLLLGAQVIAVYERIEAGDAPQEPVPMRTDGGASGVP